MFCSINSWAQNSFSLNGLWNLSQKGTTLQNTMDGNVSNHLLFKDWGFAFSFGGEFSKPLTSNIYSLSLSKRFGKSTLTARYTPGFKKEFIFSNSNGIVLEDSSFQQLNSKFTYKELLGLGYAFSFSNDFSLGFSFRYFSQEFNNQTFKPVSFGDTLFILEPESFIESSNFWKGDIGFNYSIDDFLTLSVASLNLFSINEQNISDENLQYKIRADKGALFRASYKPFGQTSINLLYETTNAFQFGFSSLASFDNAHIGLCIAAQHDKLQTPYINGLTGSILFSNDLWGISLSGIKYFNNRDKVYPFSEFKAQGIQNLINNKYSLDKAFLTITLTLNTIQEKLVRFLSVDINKDIYPAFYEAYVDTPFALGKIISLSDKTIQVRPSSKIEGINSDFTQSPIVTIQPKDTVLVPFYTIISDSYDKQKAEIAQVSFALTISGEEPDDFNQAPILINGVNSWDGKVSNLKYFIKKDLGYSMGFSKNVLSKKKILLDTILYSLSPFYKAKYIFEDFAKEITYTSDPRATTEYVQFPNETIKLRGGDCDDLSVCYSSLLESVGIETALVDYKGGNNIRHVNILFNTNLTPDDAKLITENDSKYFVRKDENGTDEIWIPIETTELTNFDAAWETGAEKFYTEAIEHLGLAKGVVEIIDVY
ncbi:MAG: transglutaminase domain-containing protein [Ignavibacteriaceae bacterium]|nr:transglutaminase domain-containing protein [Ignavibacteriaceae bacterium]